MPEQPEIDCSYTREIVCPYCGYTEKNSWEANFGENEETHYDCKACGMEFRVTRDIDVRYISEVL